jgi:hypothetical protein
MIAVFNRAACETGYQSRLGQGLFFSVVVDISE